MEMTLKHSKVFSSMYLNMDVSCGSKNVYSVDFAYNIARLEKIISDDSPKFRKFVILTNEIINIR